MAASPLHRHQSSLEGILDFSAKSPLGADERIAGQRIFYRILDHLEAEDDAQNSSSSRNNNNNNNNGRYSRPRLVRLTYEYALCEESRDSLLKAFFQAIGRSIDSQEKEISFQELQPKVFDFADYLFDNFFLPLKASGRKTPQPSPAYHSAIRQVQGAHEFAGTPDRVSRLRGECLIRDRHRCVVSRKFDHDEFDRRFMKDGVDTRDDDGMLLIEDTQQFDALEVAHILPHSLTKTNTSSQLDPSREAALMILNMFDTGVVHLIDGTDIDRPLNAITLTHHLHTRFGSFLIFFEPVPDEPPHTYTIDTLRPKYGFRDPPLPVTRTLYLTKNRTIDPPSPRLLAVHRAIAHILHLSGAGNYIDKLLRDVEDSVVRADGTTELGRLVRLGLGGWLDGTVCT